MHDLAGAIHCHSTHSDGTGTVAQVAAGARKAGLDYVLLTDHDTLAAAERGEEGWYGSTLLLAGVEISPRRENHYLAFGLREPIDHKGLTPQQIVDRVNEAGGFGFPAHPFSRGSERFKRAGEGMPWRAIDADGYTGIELWSFVTDSAERVNSVRELLSFIAAPGRYVDHPPQHNMEEWDRICRRRRCVALGGVDAHQIGLRVAGRVPLRLMAYKRSFRYLHTHLLVPERLTGDVEADRATIFDALRAGHAYIAVDALEPARGFRFQARGERTLEMGDEAPAGSYTLSIQTPAPARIRLMRDGSEIATAQSDRLEQEISEPGVYRVEAYRTTHGRERTWILSNPIYLR